ncbi:hypothetical protein AB1E18_003462 [Capra hircus]
MAGQPAAPATPPPNRDGAAPNVVARIPQTSALVMATAGVMLLLRSVRLTSKFTRSSDIPVEFIRKNEPCGVLLIKLTGVELIETGKGWLQKELKPSEVLWFQLLGKDNSALFCYLLQQTKGNLDNNLIYCTIKKNKLYRNKLNQGCKILLH